MKMHYCLLAALALVGLVTGAAKADQLFDNGGLITGTVNGHNVSELATSQGYTTYGFGTNNAASQRMADDFTPAAGQTWQLSSMKWYGYQTGSSLTSTFTGAYVTIYAGSPGGTVVAGDFTTNRLTSSTFSGIYRTIDTNTTDTSRPIMELNIDMSWVPRLTGGTTYWVGVGLNGTLPSGPWSAPVSPLPAGANAMQTLDGTTWNTVLDGGNSTKAEMPFKLNGIAVVPEANTAALLGLALPMIGAVVVMRRRNKN